MKVDHLIGQGEFPKFRYVRPPKKMRRKLARFIKRGLILKQKYLLAVPA